MRALLLAVPGLAALSLLGAAACAPQRRVAMPESQASRALPDADPTSRATPHALQPITGVERVVVKLAMGPGGSLRVVEFLSPDLTETEKAQLVDAIERGELRPEAGPERPASTWVTTVVRHRQ